MNDKTKSLTIGLFVIGAICFLAWMLLFLKPSVGDGKQVLSVRFSSIDKISVGTRVTYAGKPVGEVVSVSEVWSEVWEESKDKKEEAEKFYLYEVTLAIDSTVPVYTTDEFTVKTQGLFGEKAISIIPKPRKMGKSVRVLKGDVVYAQSTDSLEGAVNQVFELSTKMGKALDLIIELIESNEESINSFSRSFLLLSNSLSETLEQVNSSDFLGSVGRASQGIENISNELEITLKELNTSHFGEKLGSMFGHLDQIAATVDDPETIKTISTNLLNFSGDLGRLHDSFQALSESGKSFERTSSLIYSLVQSISDGHGSLGKLMTNDRLYLQMESLVGKAQVLMNDINHYGLLFHHDKNWQRERAKRINFLTRLETPQEFQNYFEEELGSIETSFSRITTVINKLQGAPMKKVSSDQAFQKGFSELLRHIELLKEQLELYNQEMMHAN